MRWIALPLSAVLLSACAAWGPGGSPPDHVAAVNAPAERIYLVLHDVYRTLGVSIASADDRSLSLASGPLRPASVGSGKAYYRCGATPVEGFAPRGQTSARIVTTVRDERGVPRVHSRLTAEVLRAGRDGSVTRHACVSTGVLEEEILRALQARL